MQRAADDTNGAVAELHGRYGEAFAFGFGPLRSHWLIGRKANAFILGERADAFRNRGAYLFLEPIGGRDALISTDEPDHLRRRRAVQPAFHRSAMAAWTDTIAARFDRLFSELAGLGPLDLHAELRRGVLALVVELLLGGAADGPDDADGARAAWRDDVAAMMDFANRPLLAQLVKVPMPGTPWWSFVRARARSDRFLFAEIARRRSRGSDGTGVLDLLLTSVDDGERALRDQLLSLVSAAFDTTSSALAWSLALLLERPERFEALREAVAPLSFESALAAEPLADHLDESLRLYPPASAGLRRTSDPVAYGEHTLPAGALVAFSIYLTHRDPETFSEPNRYRPERWRGAAPPPYGYLPFGHGARYCLGAPLARRILAVALTTLLRGYRLQPAWRGPLVPVGTTLQPAGGLPVALERLGRAVA